MAARSALGRAPHQLAGRIAPHGGATIVMGIITAEALYTNPYNARMEISDLGASETGVVLHRKVVSIPTGLLGLGVLGVGGLPATGAGNRRAAHASSHAMEAWCLPSAHPAAW